MTRWSNEWTTPKMILLPSCGAVVTVMLGCLGLLFPKAVGRVLGIDPNSPLGVSECRATDGGFVLCLGTGCLVAQSAQVFAVVGAAWCAAASARVISYAVDGTRPGLILPVWGSRRA
jgi:hypothetical protein